MALRLLKKIAQKLLGEDKRRSKSAPATAKTGRAAVAAQKGAAAGGGERELKGRAPAGRRQGAAVRRERGEPGRAAQGGVTAAPARHKPRSEQSRSGARRVPARTHDKPAPPRAVNTAADVMRPGGAVDESESARRRATHEAWSVEQYQVAPLEGKRRFHDFDLPAEILHAVADLGFEYCTPIQALSLEQALAGANVAGRAQTGTGKTAAFLVAILTRYLRTPEARQEKAGTPRALVIAPTRELVIQICKDADALGKYCGLRYLAIYGGMDYERQRRELQAAPVDLLVATPGRLLDFVNGRVVDLSKVDTLVIDEADRMLDMGFIPDVKRIIFRLPPKEKRCTMLYSATLTDDVMRLASQWMTAPVRVEVDAGTVTTSTVRQVVYIVTAREKFRVLFNLLKQNGDRRVLVFCNRRSSTERVAEELARLGVSCEMLSGDVQQNRRLRVLEDFRAGKVRVVVATDVAGRGLHVDDIGFVVNFDFPYEPDDYVHRIGRTGRAGNEGTAISFADEDESFIIPEIEKYIGEPLKCVMPEESLMAPLPAPRSEKRAHEAHTAPAPAATVITGAVESGKEKSAAGAPETVADAHAVATGAQKLRHGATIPAAPARAPAQENAAPARKTARRTAGEEWVPGQ